MTKPDWIIDNRTSYNRNQWQGANNSHEFIVLHYLGVPNADNPNLYSNGFGGHYYIHRDGRVYWSADENQVIWHVGASSGFSERHPNGWSPTNRNCIGIEMGVYKSNPGSTAATDNDWYYSTETQESAVKLVKYLMQKFNIKADHVLRHGDVTTKRCPAPWFNTTPSNRHKTNWTWDEFKTKLSETEKPKTEYVATFPNLYKGDKDANSKKPYIKLWQMMLKSEINPKTNKPYYDMDVDGIFGNGTEQASALWQRDHLLTPDAAIGINTWRKMLNVTGTVSGTSLKVTWKEKSLGETGTTISFVQRVMKAYGMYDMEIDKDFGSGTAVGLALLKSKYGIKGGESKITVEILKRICENP